MVLAKPNYFKDEVTPLKTNEVIPKLSSSGRLNDGLIIILMMKMMIKKKNIYIYIDYVNLKGCLDNFYVLLPAGKNIVTMFMFALQILFYIVTQ